MNADEKDFRLFLWTFICLVLGLLLIPAFNPERFFIFDVLGKINHLLPDPLRGEFLPRVILPLIVLAYPLPTIIAIARHHRNVPALAVINIALGWTLIGWACALSWSLYRK